MKSNPTVRALYLYLFSGLGVILMIIGAYLSVLYFVRITQFDKYPLPPYEETRCDFIDDYRLPPVDSTVSTSTQDTEIRRQECQRQLEQTRKRKETEDFTTAISLLILGGVVFSPHWRAAGRENRSYQFDKRERTV